MAYISKKDLKFKPFYRYISKHQVEQVAPPEASKRAQRRRASMKANAKKAELAKYRRAEDALDRDYREKRDRYFEQMAYGGVA